MRRLAAAKEGRSRSRLRPARRTATPVLAALLEIVSEELGMTVKDTRIRARFRLEQLVVLVMTSASVTSSVAFQVLRWRFGR